jgi:hypothetical protein
MQLLLDGLDAGLIAVARERRVEELVHLIWHAREGDLRSRLKDAREDGQHVAQRLHR